MLRQVLRRQKLASTTIGYILVAGATTIMTLIIVVIAAAALSLIRLVGKVKPALRTNGKKTK